ncbi:hypothetical protein D3C73_745980 [compost metagenome]
MMELGQIAIVVISDSKHGKIKKPFVFEDEWLLRYGFHPVRKLPFRFAACGEIYEI